MKRNGQKSEILRIFRLAVDREFFDARKGVERREKKWKGVNLPSPGARVCDAQQLAGQNACARNAGALWKSDVAAAHRAAFRELRRGKKGRAST